MAPTIWCRGEAPSNFHRRHPAAERLNHPDGARQVVPVAKEGDVPKFYSGAGDAEVALLRPHISTATGGVNSAHGGGPTDSLVPRRVASARRKQRRTAMAAAATWCQRRAVSGDITSGDEVTPALVPAARESATPCGRGAKDEECSRVSECCPRRHQSGRWARTSEGEGGPKGLLGITVRTVELMRRNQLLQWRLSLLQEETRAFVESVLSNPENRRRRGDEECRTLKAAYVRISKEQDPAVSGSC